MKPLETLYQNYISIIFLVILITFVKGLAQENIDVKKLLVNGEYENVIGILEPKLNADDLLTFSEYNILGNAYQRLMNFNKSILMLNKAKEIKPNSIHNLLLLGNSYHSIGDEISAKNILEVSVL